MSTLLFTDIAELMTLEGAVQKGARRVVESDLSLIPSAAMVCENGRIAWVGPKSKLDSKFKNAREISLENRVVLPAFVEPHTHLIFAGDRAHEFEWRIQGQTYQEISAKGGGIRFTVSETRKASESELRELAQSRATRFLKQGVTTLEVKSGYGLDLDTEMRSLKIARGLQGPRVITTYLGAHSKSPDFADLDLYLKHILEVVLPEVKRSKLADRVDIYIENGFFTPEQAKSYLTAANGLGISAHVEQLSDSGGTEIVLGFSPQSVDHLVFASDHTIARLARTETTAVLLPTSDFYLKMQYPRARKMIDEGVRVALSTDFNPGTSPTQDLSFVGVLSRLEMKMSLPEVLSAYTLGAAYALGVEREVGSLTVGKHCDFILLEGSWRELFYSVGHHPIAKVFREGNQVS